MSDLKRRSLQIFPDFEFIISAGSDLSKTVWESDLSTGKALEFVSLLALIREVKDLGASVHIDSYFHENPSLYYLRNEIPYHHGAQAGHDAVLDNEFTLFDRFVAALLPRATFEINGKKYMLFREGNPLHLIEAICIGRSVYRERPDLAIVGGFIELISVKRNEISIIHHGDEANARIEMSVKNSNLIPLKKYLPKDAYEVNTYGLVECSVSKTKSHVDNQLDNYVSLFGSSGVTPDCLFIHGKNIKSKYRTSIVDMSLLVEDIGSSTNRAIMGDYLKGILGYK